MCSITLSRYYYVYTYILLINDKLNHTCYNVYDFCIFFLNKFQILEIYCVIIHTALYFVLLCNFVSSVIIEATYSPFLPVWYAMVVYNITQQLHESMQSQCTKRWYFLRDISSAVCLFILPPLIKSHINKSTNNEVKCYFKSHFYLSWLLPNLFD